MPAFSTLTDDFADGAIAAAWTSSTGVTETGGRAQIASASTWPSLISGSVYSLAGSQVSAQVTPAPGTGRTTSAYTSMTIAAPGAPVGSRLIINFDAPSSIRFGADVDWWDTTGVSLTYDPTAMAWWRIRATTTQVFFETSPNGTTWTTRHTAAMPTWATGTDLSVSFQAYQDAGTSQALIDNVNSTGAPVTLAPAAVRIRDTAGAWKPVTIKSALAAPAPVGYQPVSSLAGGASATGPYTFRRAVSYTNGARTSPYHIDASAASPATPAPVVIHLHGDGYEEYTTMAAGTTTSVAYAYRDAATAQKAIFVLPRTPDTSSQTWYTAAYATTWLVALINELKSTYNIDTKRVFFSGFSGGAEQVTYNMLADHHGLMIGGGAMMLGGGDAEGVSFSGTPSAQLKANFPMRWFVGENDIAGATQPADWSAQEAAARGEAFYRAAGFMTSIRTIPGRAHNDSETHGPALLSQVMNESNAIYGLPAVAGPAEPIAPVSVFASTSTVTPSATTSKAAPRPSCAPGNVIVFCLAVQGTTSNVTGAALPAGFTVRANFTRASNANLRFIMGTKTAGASEPSSYTPTIPSGVTMRADVLVLTGADASTVGTAPAVESAASTSYAAPSVTPSTDRGAILSVAVNSGGASWTPPPGMTEVTDLFNGANPYLAMTTAFQVTASRTATGTRTFTATGNFTGITSTLYVGAAPAPT